MCEQQWPGSLTQRIHNVFKRIGVVVAATGNDPAAVNESALGGGTYNAETRWLNQVASDEVRLSQSGVIGTTSGGIASAEAGGAVLSKPSENPSCSTRMIDKPPAVPRDASSLISHQGVLRVRAIGEGACLLIAGAIDGACRSAG